MTRHGVRQGSPETWAPIAGGIDLSDPNAYEAGIRETLEEAHIKREHVIFVRGRNYLAPHVALLQGPDKSQVGLIFDVTYSGPKIPFAWEIHDDPKVDRVELFPWQRVLRLLENPDSIYRPDFNVSQLLRWTLMNHGGTASRTNAVDAWLREHAEAFPGLRLRPNRTKAPRLLDRWEYIPPYDDWWLTPNIHGSPRLTNFARARSKWAKE
jgi:8-oxo-dGTP pyrophosphatase MutT (NUDIX family)